MKLTDKHAAHINKWLRERAGGTGCPECSANKSIFWDNLYLLPKPSSAGRAEPPVGRLVVVIECTECGHIRTFSARTMGLAKRDEKHKGFHVKGPIH